MRDLNKYNFESPRIEGNLISGVINNEENGILTLSIPYNDGWKCFVDGEKRNTLKVNGIFTGIELTKGKHNIIFEFSVPFLSESFYILLFSLMISMGIVFYKKCLAKKRFFSKNC